MSSLSYKEIPLTFPFKNIFKIKGNSFNNNTFSSFTQSKTFGKTYNYNNYIIYVISNSNILTSIIVNLSNNLNNNNLNENFTNLKSYEVDSNILENITILPYDKFFIVIFFTLNKIYFFYINSLTNEVENQKDFAYNSSIQLKCIEFLNSNGNLFQFVLGCLDGNLYLLEMEMDYNRNLLINKTFEKLNQNNQTHILQRITLNLFNYSNSKNENIIYEINSMVYIGNNLLCYLKTNYIFEVYDLLNKKIIYTEDLNKNKYDNDLIISSKILYNVVNYNINEFQNIQSKSFNIIININNELNYNLISFELVFNNVNFSNLNINSSNFQYIYNNIYLGNNISIRNKKNIVLKGNIIDMSLNENKLWLIILKNNLELYENKYEFKIMNVSDYYEYNNNEVDTIFNNYNHNITTIEYNEKKILYLIKLKQQIDKNLSLTNSKRNLIYFGIIENENYFNKQLLIDYINKKFFKSFINKDQILNFIYENYLIEDDMNNDNDKKTLFEDIIKPLIDDQLNNNKILSIGNFKGNDNENIIILRQKGISFMKLVDLFEKMDEIIKYYENEIRKILNKSNSNSIDLGNIEDKISTFLYSEISKENTFNSLLCILSLIRVYLTETNLLLLNENNLIEYFNENNIFDLINNEIGENIENQYNISNNIEFFHQLIYDIYFNHKEAINNNIIKILNEFDRYFVLEDNENIEIDFDENNSNNSNINFCELISKLVKNKILSLFNISRDIICFLKWKEKNLNDFDEIEEEENENYNLDIEITKNANNFFIRTLTLYLLSNHSTFFEMGNVSDDKNSRRIYKYNYKDLEISYTQFVIQEKFSQYAGNNLMENKNRLIQFIIKTILNDIYSESENKINNSFLFKIIIYLKDIKFLELINQINETLFNKIFSIKLKILISLLNEEKNKLRKALNEYYTLKNYNLQLAYLDIRKEFNLDFFSGQKNFIESNSEIVNEFYLITFNYMIDDLNLKNDSNIINDFICKVYDLFNYEEYEKGLILYSMIKNNKYINIYNNSKNSIILKFSDYIKKLYKEKIVFNQSDFTYFINQIKYSYPELLLDICNYLHDNFYNLDINTIKEYISENKDVINIYKILNYIYSNMKQFKKLLMLCLDYSESIKNTIETDSCNDLLELIGLFNEKKNTLNDAIIAYKKCKEKMEDIELFDIEKEASLNEMRLKILYLYNDNKISNIREKINEEQIISIKSDDRKLFDLIFRLNLINCAVQMNIVRYLNYDESQLFIYNMITNLKRENEKNMLNLFINHLINYKVIDCIQMNILKNLIED